MREVIDQADRVSKSLSADGRCEIQDRVSGKHAVPEVWFAAILVPLIIGCTLFAATGS